MRGLKDSLKGKMLYVTVLPLLGLIFLVAAVSVETFSVSMTRQVEDSMRRQCQLIEKLYDQIYPGEYSVKMGDGGNYTIYKGREDITSDFSIIDNVAQTQGMEISIFCQNIRVLTTIKDASGERIINTKASPVVKTEVLETAQDKFYTDVTIGRESNFAYYKPIILADGTVFGMLSISHPSADVAASVRRAVMPIILICIAAMVMIGFISIMFSSRFIVRIHQLQQFMATLAGGDFSAEIPTKLLQLGDELGDLAKSGKQMQQSLRQLVEFDALTGLHNRRYGSRRLAQVQEKARRSGIPFSVCISDIDFFKKVNDTYGHEAGDEVLSVAADILRRHMAGKGFVARWGGEEFLLVFERMQVWEAAASLEKLLGEIRKIEVNYQGQIIRLTMSCGVTQAEEDESIDAVLRRADGLLYYCKTHGRNQVCCRMDEEVN